MKKIDEVLRKAAIAHYWSMWEIFDEENDILMFHFYNLKNDLICLSPIYVTWGIPSYYAVGIKTEEWVRVKWPFGKEIDRITIIVDALE